MVLECLTDQQLINALFARLQNERRARDRGDALSISQHKATIEQVLNELERRGYCKLECLEACE